MGDILKKITELLNDGADIEQQRSTGIILNSKVGWFDAVDSEDDGRAATAVSKGSANDNEDSED